VSAAGRRGVSQPLWVTGFRSRNQSALTGGGPTASPAREPKLAPVNSKNSIFNGYLHPHAADVAWPPPPERGSISQPDSTRSPTRWPLAGPQPDQVMPLRQDCALTSARRGWPLLSPQPGRDFTTQSRRPSGRQRGSDRFLSDAGGQPRAFRRDTGPAGLGRCGRWVWSRCRRRGVAVRVSSRVPAWPCGAAGTVSPSCIHTSGRLAPRELCGPRRTGPPGAGTSGTCR
jgi:hypothetical protein